MTSVWMRILAVGMDRISQLFCSKNGQDLDISWMGGARQRSVLKMTPRLPA